MPGNRLEALKEIAGGNTAFGSTVSGESDFPGKREMPMTWK